MPSLCQEIQPNGSNDPALSRLFWMSTGETMPEETFSIGCHEVFLFVAGYAPAQSLDIHAAFIPVFLFFARSEPGEEAFWSIGSKYNLHRSTSLLRSVGVGLDIMNLGMIDGTDIEPAGEAFSRSAKSSWTKPDLVSVNLALSLGIAHLMGHTNLVHVWSLGSPSTPQSETYVQVGGEFTLSSRDDRGMKLIAETTISRDIVDGYGVSLLLAGFRIFTTGAAVELAWPFARSNHGLEALLLPYGSITLFF